MTNYDSKQFIRSSVSKLMLGGAMACLLAAPASATGWANSDPWAGLWGGIGIGAVVMDADAKVNTSRDGAINAKIECQEKAYEVKYLNGSDGEIPEGRYVDGCPVKVHDQYLGFLKNGKDGGASIAATLFPLLQQQILNLDGSSDAGVMGTISAGYDFRSGNFVFGPFISFDFFDVESKFSSQVWAEGGTPSIDFGGKKPEPCSNSGCESAWESQNGLIDPGFLIGLGIGAAAAHAIRDEHIEIDGKIKQDYALQVGGRMGYVWNETFMTYFGAAWTRTSIDGHVNIHIADPLCGGPEGSKLCGFADSLEKVNLVNTPTNIRLDLDEEVDGYKLLVGGEYLMGYAAGGNWFLRGQAEYHDYDGFSEHFSGQKNQQIFSKDGGYCREKYYDVKGDDGYIQRKKTVCKPSIDVTRLINEQAWVDIDKEDYSVHAALVYKFGGAPVPLGKPMK